MDRLIYVAMTGAAQALERHAMAAHNLSNAGTPGYRAALGAFRAVPVEGAGVSTRVFVAGSTAGASFAPAPIEHTGRDLDVAVNGQGWIAVQSADGTEAYTRAGNLQVGSNGLLQTRSGLNVLGDGGVIAIPPDTNITIAKDGTISTVPSGARPNAVTVVGRIKLVNPPERELFRGDDGLFRLRGGGQAPADAGVTVTAGALEGSNVNAIEELVNLIALARRFELHVKLLQSAEENSRRAGQIMDLRS
jgi:flagellar basal-body rod protein FlgF